MNDLRCTTCGRTVIEPVLDDREVIYRCVACSCTFRQVWGVPYFGAFEGEDVASLIEIAANVVNRGKFGVNPTTVESWERMFAAYHRATDKEAFVREYPEARSPSFLPHYGGWEEISVLCESLDLNGRAVLDVGAGLGVDSHRLAMRGAHVTALEISPILAESGRQNFPHIRWIGGFSHCLPFRDASFDAVFCNAALHHMRDIPAAISEALRVLRPGGTLVTTRDSFRASDSPDDAELAIFGADPSVLLGSNGNVPRFSEFVSMFEAHSDIVDVGLFTHALHATLFKRGITTLTCWDFPRDVGRLASRGGSLALRVKLKSNWPRAAGLQGRAVLDPAEYARLLDSESGAVASLARLMPSRHVDLPFPGERGSKFELLNGWRPREPGSSARIAYKRGRWFLRRPSGDDAMIFEVALPPSSLGNCIRVLLDGVEVLSHPMERTEWRVLKVDLGGIPAGDVFALEIRLEGGGEKLEEAAFMVRGRRFACVRTIAQTARAMPAESRELPVVFAVIPVFNRLHFTRECIACLKRQSYGAIRIVVADGGSTDGTVEAIRAEHPDVTVLTSERELWWAGSMAMGIDHVLTAGGNDRDFVLMMNNDTIVAPDYVATLVFAARTYDAAVGALIVDSADQSRVLDAGEYIDWATYSFPVKTLIHPDERFCGDVDVLPGRGSLFPLAAIRRSGNVDAEALPHYLADYEFACRLRRDGLRLGVCYEARVLAHIEETGIVPKQGRQGFAEIWRHCFSRRSMSNVVDHWRFVRRHAPRPYRGAILRRLATGVVADLTLRTPARPLFLPVWWLLRLPRRTVSALRREFRAYVHLRREWQRQGNAILCSPNQLPRSLRIPLFLLACPGPLSREDCSLAGLDSGALAQRGIIRPLAVTGWFALETMEPAGPEGSEPYKALRGIAFGMRAKIERALAYRRALVAEKA